MKNKNLTVNYDNEFESIFIETKLNSNNYVIGEIYRTPNSNKNISINRFDLLINKCLEISKNIIIGTDQNMDYLKINENPCNKTL